MKKTHWKILLAWCLCWGWGMLVQAELPDAETTLAKAQETTKNSNYIAKRLYQGTAVTDYYKVMADGVQLNRTEYISQDGILTITIKTENGTYDIVGNLAIKKPVKETVSISVPKQIHKEYSIEEITFKNRKCYKIVESYDNGITVYFINQENNLIQGRQWLNNKKQIVTIAEYDSIEINNELDDKLFQVSDSLLIRNPATLEEASTIYAQEFLKENNKKDSGKKIWDMNSNEIINTVDHAQNANVDIAHDISAVMVSPSRPQSKIWLIIIGLCFVILIAFGAYTLIMSLKNR